MQLVSATYQVAVANKTNVSSMVMVSSCRFMRVSRWTRESAGAGEITPNWPSCETKYYSTRIFWIVSLKYLLLWSKAQWPWRLNHPAIWPRQQKTQPKNLAGLASKIFW
jgi:hypothetical protein